MAFRFSDCAVPTVWCGNGAVPQRDPESDTRYRRAGTRVECMRKGFGAGKYTEISRRLPAHSLRKIKYLSVDHDARLRDAGITRLNHLVHYAQTHAPEEINEFLQEIFTQGGTQPLDRKAYNSTLVYLYRHGVGELPRCTRIR